MRLSLLFPANPRASHPGAAGFHTPSRRAGLCGSIVLVLLIGGGLARGAPNDGPAENVVSIADRLAAFVEEASQRFGVPASWIRAVMRIESGGEVHAVSAKGAMGLMQIMPQTWSALRLRYGLGIDPYDAHDNILAGSAYLRELWERYGAPGFLAAYNAGPARYEDHLATGRPLPAETRAYDATIVPAMAGRAINGSTIVASMVRSWTEAPLFTRHADGSTADAHVASNLQGGQRRTVDTTDHPAMFAVQSDALFVTTAGRISQP